MKELRPFIDKINPNKRLLNSMIILVFGLFCLLSAITILTSRYGNSMLYDLLKQVQLFTIASVSSGATDRVELAPAKIETRRDLVTYLTEYVPSNFFYTKELLEQDELATVEKEFNSPLLQRNMEIIG